MIKKIWNGFTTVMVVLVLILAILLVGVRFVGLKPFVVLSGSMEPTYHVGSLIYVREADPQDLQPGDAITFLANETTVVTHRIADVVPDEDDPDTLWFITKGDANQSEDASPVHYRNVIGKAVFSIPYLGYLSHYIQNPPGLYIALGVGAVMLILAFMPTGKKKDQAPETTG